MKTLLVVLMLFVSGLVWLNASGLRPSESQPVVIPVCGTAGTEKITLSAEGRYTGALPGWGSHSYPVTTDSDSAQYFFDQGLSLYYGYHFKEAVASFKESSRWDEENAMAYWGQALAMGPYYNAAHSYSKPAALNEVLQKMNRHAASPKEKQLIAAMNSRYSNDPEDRDRASLNAAYARAMRSLVTLDDEAKILYVDAVMLMHAWDFWHPDGTPQPWTAELTDYTTEVLKNNPRHPAALHYHIHLTEASRQPEVALANADLLKELMPGVPHMVHMASHEYERNGLYPLGVEVNNHADSNLRVYNEHAKHLGLNTQSPHYFAVQTYCALTGGMYDDALRYAFRTRESVSPSAVSTYDQYLFMLPALTHLRMGKWDAILQDPVRIPGDWTYAGLLSDFVKGIASVHTGNPGAAKTYLQELQKKQNDPVLEKRRIPFNAPVQMARIAEKLLEGTMLSAQNRPEEAIARMEEAVQMEDQLIYTEPKDWPVPSRQFLGAYLIRQGQAARAEAVYRQDLAKNPGNGWSLLGLSQSLQATGRVREAGELQSGIRQAFSHANELPEASVYWK